MTNTSATGGFLSPSSTTGNFGTAFEDFLHATISGVTGLDGALIRPRWQRKPPPYPADDVTWMAFGIMAVSSDGSAATVHEGAGDGHDRLLQHERVTVLASAYGPGALSLASLLRDGLQIPQNREALGMAGVKVHDCSQIIVSADFVKQQWVPRVDLTIDLSSVIDRVYPVLNLLSAQGAFISDGGLPPGNFTVEP